MESAVEKVTVFYGVRLTSLEEEKAKKAVDYGLGVLFRNYRTITGKKCYELTEYEPEFCKWNEWKDALVFVGMEIVEISLPVPVQDCVEIRGINSNQIKQRLQDAGIPTDSLGHHMITTIHWE